jgi:hypothetical protein
MYSICVRWRREGKVGDYTVAVSIRELGEGKGRSSILEPVHIFYNRRRKGWFPHLHNGSHLAQDPSFIDFF